MMGKSVAIIFVRNCTGPLPLAIGKSKGQGVRNKEQGDVVTEH